MYYQVEQVLEQQEPEIEKFYKGRGLLICEAKQGLFALRNILAPHRRRSFYIGWESVWSSRESCVILC